MFDINDSTRRAESPGAEPGARLRLTLAASADGEEETVVECDAAAGMLIVDRTQSSLSFDSGPVEFQEFQRWDSPRAEVEMRLLVDGSVAEMFIDGLSMTTRAYPTKRDSTGVSLDAVGGVVKLLSAESWPLAAI